MVPRSSRSDWAGVLTMCDGVDVAAAGLVLLFGIGLPIGDIAA
jgi:hypothetical protein